MNKVSRGLNPKNFSSPTSGSKSVANLLDELVKADFSDGADTKTAAILTQLTGVDSSEVRNWLEDPDADGLEKRAKRLTNALEKTRCTEQNLWLALVESGALHGGEKKANEVVIARTCLALARSQSHDLVVCDKLFDIVDTMGDQKTKKYLLTSMACQLVVDINPQWLSSAVRGRMTTSVLKLLGPAREKLIGKLIKAAESCTVTDPATWQFIASLASPNGPTDLFRISGDTFEQWINTLDENGVLDSRTWTAVLAVATPAMLDENMPIVLDALRRHECADCETWLAALTAMTPRSRASECHELLTQHDMPDAFMDAMFRCMADLEPEGVGNLLSDSLVKDSTKSTVSKALGQLHRLLDSADITGRADSPCVRILNMCIEGGLSWDELIALLPPPSEPGAAASVCAMLLALNSASELTQERRAALLSDPGIAVDKSVASVMAYVQSARWLCVKWSQAAEMDSLSPRDEPGATLVHEFSAFMTTRYEEAGATTNDKRLEVASRVRAEIEPSPGVSTLIIRRMRSFADLEIERFKFAVEARASSTRYLNKMRCPEEDGWRLLMDAKCWEHGMYHFDNECGYMAGMQRGLNWVLGKLGVPLTSDLYRELHDTAIDGVFDLGGHIMVSRAGEGSKRHLWNWEFAKGYRSGRVRFGLNFEKGGNATEAGFAEYQADRSKNQPNGNMDGSRWTECIENNEYSPSVPHLSDRYYLTLPPVQDTAAVKRKVDEIIQTYYSELSAAQTLEDPLHRQQAELTCIAKLCQDLDQYHVFSDGNVRTAVLLMNKLLLENGYSPTTFDNPNVIDMHSLRELVELIRHGQAMFAKLLLSEI